jgi:hypothetical protein
MKYICKHACIWRGVYTTPDTIVDMTDDELKAMKPQIDGSFAPVDASGLPVDDKPDRYGMTRAQYRERLSGFGVAISPTATSDELHKLLEQHLNTKTRKSVK